MPAPNRVNIGESEFNPFISNVLEGEASHNDACGQVAKNHQIASIFAELDVNQEES
jgi:hypothetical protein